MIKNKKSEKKIRITFFNKTSIICPICGQSFYKEELLSGRGRLIVEELTPELKRTYTKSEKYGDIYPLVYAPQTCPTCFYSTLPEDFQLPIKTHLLALKNNISYRQNFMKNVFPDLSFLHSRNLFHGAASYIMAITSYSFFEKQAAPSLKKAICSIRVSWIYDEIFNLKKNPLYETCRDVFYEKASIFYKKSLIASENGSELFDNVRSYGPDINSNFGYPGLVYLANFLQLKLIKNEPIENQVEILKKSKLQVSKLFGSGSASKSKPGPLLNYSRSLYNNLTEKIKALESFLSERES